MTFDPNKPCKTRNGQEVELVTTEGRGSWPLIGYVGDSTEYDCWRKDGTVGYGGPNDFDLVNTPQERFVWVNVYKFDDGQLYSSTPRSLEESERLAGNERVGRIKIKLVEGQWDD